MSSSAIRSSMVMSCGLGDDLGAPAVAVRRLELAQLAADLFQHQPVGAEDGAQPLDELHQLAVLLHHLLALQAGERCRRMSRIACACTSESAKPVIRRSRASAGVWLARMVAITSSRWSRALRMPSRMCGPLLGLAQVVAGAPDDHRLAVVEEVTQHLLERHHLRLVVDDRQHDDAEGGLHLRQLVERVEDHLRHLAPFHLDDDADAVAVGLVAQVGDRLRASCRAPARRCARSAAPC